METLGTPFPSGGGSHCGSVRICLELVPFVVLFSILEVDCLLIPCLLERELGRGGHHIFRDCRQHIFVCQSVGHLGLPEHGLPELMVTYGHGP